MDTVTKNKLMPEENIYYRWVKATPDNLPAETGVCKVGLDLKYYNAEKIIFWLQGGESVEWLEPITLPDIVKEKEEEIKSIKDDIILCINEGIALTKENAELKKEVERLKGVVELGFIGTKQAWERFKIKNKI